MKGIQLISEKKIVPECQHLTAPQGNVDIRSMHLGMCASYSHTITTVFFEQFKSVSNRASELSIC